MSGFKIVAVLIEDDAQIIEAIAPLVLAMQDLGEYATEADGSSEMVNLVEVAAEHREFEAAYAPARRGPAVDTIEETVALDADIEARHAAYHGEVS